MTAATRPIAPSPRRKLLRPGCGGDFWRAGAGPDSLPPAPFAAVEGNRCARALALAQSTVRPSRSNWGATHADRTHAGVARPDAAKKTHGSQLSGITTTSTTASRPATAVTVPRAVCARSSPGTPGPVKETLPASDSESSLGDSGERRVVTEADTERRITVLFRRWPALNNREGGELRRLWDERIRRTKQRAT